MHAEHPDSDNEKIRFAREAELVMKLQHPHVVPLLDYGHTVDDVPFLVFALLEGQSLERKIKGSGSMPWAQTGRLSVHVLKALEKAHGMGVVHRDIKPANIFLCDGVLGEVAQVLDFGLAKMVKEPDNNLTQAGALLGTPRYMAPEQVRGETITHAADIYSFGLVMAEMLLGRPLVTGAKELDIYVAQGSDKPIHVPDEVLSTPYGNIIRRAVNKKVEVRYHMASQMLADVQAVLSNIEGPQQDIEADLDATRMLDPSAAAVLSNPHAEKMRRVLNAAANKKAEQEAKKRAASGVSAKRAEMPTRVPPRPEPEPQKAPESGIVDEPTAATLERPVDPAVVASAPPLSGPLSTAPMSAESPVQSASPGMLHASMAAAPVAAPVAAPGVGAPLSAHGGAAQLAASPVAAPRVELTSAPEVRGPMESDPSAYAGRPQLASAPEVRGPMSSNPLSVQPAMQPAMQPSMNLQPSHAPQAAPAVAGPPVAGGPMRPPMVSAAMPPPKQTGIVVALVFVLVLIAAGVGAILWMLGYVDLPI